MRTLPWILAVMLIAAPALTGCIGVGGEGGDSDEAGNQTNETNETNETNDSNTSGNGSEDDSSDGFIGDEEADGSSWRSENRTGTVSGTSQLTGGTTETFTVEDGAEQLMLNLTADGGELEMCIREPGDNSSGHASGTDGFAQQEACSETETTQDGNASFQASAPDSGEWSVELTAAQPTTGEIEYTLTIAQKVPG